MFHNKCGLIGSKTAKNKEQKIQSKRHNSDDIIMQMADMIKQHVANKALQERLEKLDEISLEENMTEDFIRAEAKKYIEDIFSSRNKKRKIQLIDLLNSYNKEDLKDLALIYNMKKVSVLNKAELANHLKEKMLMTESLRDVFVVLSDDEIRLFEKVSECETAYYIQEGEEDLLQNLVDMGYIGITMDNQVDIPEDVINLYDQVNTDEFKNLRQKISWLLACFDMASWLYGAVPAKIMVKVFNQKKGLKTDYHQLIEDYGKIPQSQKDFNLLGELFVHRNLQKNDNYIYLMKNQGNKDYYIPTEQEIVSISKNQFIMYDSNVKNLVHYFVNNLDIPEEEATIAIRDMQHQINGGCSMHDIFDVINDRGISFNSQNDLNQIVPLINNLWNNTRMLLNRGYKPNELFEDERKHMRPLGPGNMPTIVPVSSSAAKLLMEGKEQIEQMGFSVDLNSGATEMPVYSMSSGINGSIDVSTKKIYPNDPCPCGSGKKYKKCCGR
jgi:hypothetical protein